MDSTSSRRFKEYEKDAYEMQQFNFSARQVSEQINYMVQDSIQDNVEKLKCCLLAQCVDVSPTSIESATETFLKVQHAEVEKLMKEISIAVEEFFGVPPNALLEEDALQAKQYTKADEIRLDEEIALLKQRAKRAVILEECLRKEYEVIERVKALETMQRKNLEQLDFDQSELKSQLTSSKRKCMLDIVEAIRATGNDCFGSSIKASDGAAKRFQCS